MAAATLCAVSRNIVDERCLCFLSCQELFPAFLAFIMHEQGLTDGLWGGGDGLKPFPLVAAAVGDRRGARSSTTWEDSVWSAWEV